MDIGYKIWRESKDWKRKKFAIHFVVVYGLIMNAASNFEVNGKILKQPKSSSLHRQIIMAKGSSVWLDWQIAHLGSGIAFGAFSSSFKNQTIGFKSASQANLEVVAKRIGQNGTLTLQSSIPAPFSGRVEVISSNSTLVIHDLQYNDSLYQFSSNIALETSPSGTPIPPVIHLTPSIQLTIIGVPEFITQLPSTLDVKEQSNLELRIEMNGNPPPSADFKWSHLPMSTTVSSEQLYPFVYSSTYSLHNINGSYCGRNLQVMVKNNIGSSSSKNINVTVILKLNQPLDITARKIPSNRCIEVKWKKIESGACSVKYVVKFKNQTGNHLYNETGYNIGEVKACNLSEYDYITDAQLIISFNTSSVIFDVKIISILASKFKSIEQNIHDVIILGDSIRWSIFLIVSIALILHSIREMMQERNNTDYGPPIDDKEEGKYILVEARLTIEESQEFSNNNKISQ